MAEDCESSLLTLVVPPTYDTWLEVARPLHLGHGELDSVYQPRIETSVEVYSLCPDKVISVGERQTIPSLMPTDTLKL